MQSIIDIQQGDAPCITTIFSNGKKRRYQLGVLNNCTTYSINVDGVNLTPDMIKQLPDKVENYQYVSYIDYYLVGTEFHQKTIIKHLFALSNKTMLEMRSEIYD